MKDLWKWILGILLVLAFFIAFGSFTYYWGKDAAFYGHPMMYRFDANDWQMPHSGFDRSPMQMIPNSRWWGSNGFWLFVPFMFFGGLLRLLLPLGILALTAYLAYQKGKADGSTATSQNQRPPAELKEQEQPIS